MALRARKKAFKGLDLSEEEIGRMWNEEPVREEDEAYETTQKAKEVQGDEENILAETP